MKRYAMGLSAMAMLVTGAAGFCAEERTSEEGGRARIETVSMKCPSGLVQSGEKCVKPSAIYKGTSEAGKVKPYSSQDIGTSEKGMVKY